MFTITKGDFVYINNTDLPNQYVTLFNQDFFQHKLKAVIVDVIDNNTIVVVEQLLKKNTYSYSTSTNKGTIIIDTQNFIIIPSKYAIECTDESFLSSSCAIYKIKELHKNPTPQQNLRNETKNSHNTSISQKTQTNKCKHKCNSKINSKKTRAKKIKISKRKYAGLRALSNQYARQNKSLYYITNPIPFQGGGCSGK